jgi:hypothetical protein
MNRWLTPLMFLTLPAPTHVLTRVMAYSFPNLWLCCVVLCCVVLCCVVLCCAVLCCVALRWSALHAFHPVQCSAVQCSAVQCSAVQCSAVQCSAVQNSVHCIESADYRYLASFIPVIQHNHKRWSLFINHLPEVIKRVNQRTVGCYVSFLLLKTLKSNQIPMNKWTFWITLDHRFGDFSQWTTVKPPMK